MKKLLVLFIAISIFACKEEPKDYVTFSGKIENHDANSTLKVFKGKEYEKIITVNEDGTFKDTLKVVDGDHNFQYGKEYGQIYLKNNNESSFTSDYNNFVESIVFGGDDADINNFSVQSFLIANKSFTKEVMTNGTSEDIDAALKNYKSAYEDLKVKYSNVDSTHIAIMDKNIEGVIKQIGSIMSSKTAAKSTFPKGTPSPKFVSYENYAGGNTSLDDLKGKYVYIDVWATWCKPCLVEIPSLKKVEEQYKGKNIAFVSLSIDEGRGYQGSAAEAYKGWKKMIADKDLGGIQLLADKGFRSSFVEAYKINGIPRFILIDPQGNIVDADAPRPSNPELIKLFNDLNI